MRIAVPAPRSRTTSIGWPSLPVGVAELVGHGHEVFIQAGAGIGSSISDAEYVAQGATDPADRSRYLG